MPYREKKIISGDYFESEIFIKSDIEKKQTRKQKESLSTIKQQNLNDKNAKKYATRLINTNFTDDDIALTITYRDDTLPETAEEARKDVVNFIRRLKRKRKELELSELKYIAVIEFKEQTDTGKAVRIHHHLVLSGGMDRKVVQKTWKKGRANVKDLQADEFGYEGLARYMTKDPKGKRRWTSSKNLKKPKVRVNDHKFSKRAVENMAKSPDDNLFFEKLYPGYTFTECKVDVNTFTGGTSLYIKMRKIRE